MQAANSTRNSSAPGAQISNSTLSGLIYLPKRTLNINTAAASNSDVLNILVGWANLNTVSNWTIQPLSTSGSASGGAGAPSYLKS